MIIDAKKLDYHTLNELIDKEKECTVDNCMGQRFIASGMKDKKIVLKGIPGNALGAYLAGAEISVYGNAQDAVGDTMNEGRIIVHGNIGDAPGYAMRGGKILIKGDAGYRVGIHMKEYKDKKPVIVIGGTCGSFLGEYQAGGVLVVLNMNDEERIVGNFPCTAMHGGKVFLRGDISDIIFPGNVTVRETKEEDLAELNSYLKEFSECFGIESDYIFSKPFYVVVPNSSNPYKQMYVAN